MQDNGLGLELNVVAIVLLGGVSIFGGKGSIVGVVLAVFVYAALQNALFLTSFPQRAFGIVTGCLLLLSVLDPERRLLRRAREGRAGETRARSDLRRGQLTCRGGLTRCADRSTDAAVRSADRPAR